MHEQSEACLRLELHQPPAGEESYIDLIKSRFVQNYELTQTRLNSDHIRQAWNLDVIMSCSSDCPEPEEPNALEEVVILPKGLSVNRSSVSPHLKFVSNFVDEEENSFPAGSYVPSLLELNSSIQSCSSGVSEEELVVLEEQEEADDQDEEEDLIAGLEEDSLTNNIQKLGPVKYTLGPSDDFVTIFD